MAVSTIAAIGVAVAASSAGYQVSENEAAKDQAREQRRKQELTAAKNQADLKAREDADIKKKDSAAIAASTRAKAPSVYSPAGFVGTSTANSSLSSLIGSTPGNSGARTLIGG